MAHEAQNIEQRLSDRWRQQRVQAVELTYARGGDVVDAGMAAWYVAPGSMEEAFDLAEALLPPDRPAHITRPPRLSQRAS